MHQLMSSLSFEDFTPGLCRPVGMSVGAEFSSEDVKRLYCNVFHVPSGTGEAQRAMKKIAGGDKGWSCVGENVVDVLLEMERERERNEQLYWDLQLLNGGNLNDLCRTQQSTDSDIFLTAYGQSDLGSARSCKTDTADSEMGTREGRKDGSVRRLKKAARQCWARLASEGLRTMVPVPRQGGRPGVKVHAWGCVSLSDVLLLVEVKYDVVTRLLYTEMLQEHHTPRLWETLLPWQRHREHEGLEDFAEEVLISGDVLSLAELPGAFRIYRACWGAPFRNCSTSEERSWSALSLLYELHTCRQQERDALTVLGERLDRESLRLLCLHIRLATLRAQRENKSHAAFLAARQSWETWPHSNNPCRTEQAVLWLQSEEEEHNDDLLSASPQQHSVLHLLVLSQEQERKHLVKLVHGVSPEDLQGEAFTVPITEESNREAALRYGCTKRLREIHASLQLHNVTQSPLEQAGHHVPLHSKAQPQTHPQIISTPALWPQDQVEGCALLLLTHLLELQDAQAAALLPELMDMSVQHLQVLQAKYESELQAQHCTNLLQLLTPEGAGTSSSILTPSPKLINSSNEQMTTQPSQPQNSGYGLVQAADGTNKQDVCTGCGAIMEELPYLEILCVTDALTNTYQSTGAEKDGQEEERESTASAQSYEKQGSLITLAWSKPPDGDTDYEAESADGGTGLSLDSENSVQSRIQSSGMSSTAEHMHSDETYGKSPDDEAGSTGQGGEQRAEQQCSTDRQVALEDRPMADQPHNEEAVSECALQTHTPQDVPPHALVDLPKMKPHADDLCPGLSSDTADVGSDGAVVEPCPPAIQSDLWDLKEHDLTDAEDQKYSSQTEAACDLAESWTLTDREQMREPVSAIERERTMRNLVDMQKKVEQRHQRDRERQLLRVQERLSIIQNKKAEEDLLGLKHTDRLKHLTQDLPQEDKKQQKTVVRERLEQLRRERSYVMQSKRDRNTAGLKELLGPVTLHRETEDVTD